jgi:tetratricopeptide (TPR) repeat protein
MSTLEQAFDLANDYLRKGDIQQAEQLYHLVLHSDPRHAGALHGLGLIAWYARQHEVAVAYLQRALSMQPDFAEAQCNLGSVLLELNHQSEAEACFREALRLRPDFVEAHCNLGNALQRQGKLEEAAASLHEALRYRPEFADAHHHLGNLLWEQGKLAEAASCFRQALSYNPNFAAAHNNLAGVLLEQDQVVEAKACLEEALRLDPHFADAHQNLGTVLSEQGHLPEAAAAYRQALGLNPRYAEAHSNLSNVLRQLGMRDEAMAHVQEALRLKPDFADALNNLGNILADQRKMVEAEAAYRQALRANPQHAWIHHNLGAHLLLMGKFEEGWPEYEWRLKTRKFALRPFAQPLWDGSPLDGKTILLHAEQGLGDTAQFIRYAPLVKERGGQVVVECPAALTQLLARSPGIDRLVSAGSPLPPFEVQAPLLSLPGIFRTSVATIPANVPYVFADPPLTESWHRQLGAAPGFKVGIAWRGSSRHKRDRERSFSLETMAPLAAVAGVHLFSLQVGAGREELAALAGRLGVTDLGRHFDPASFADVAAVISSLDLVITVDSALAHVAGALGAPVWVALPFSPDWRWQLEREDSPWYPTMRLFRQHNPGNWPEVFERLAGELRHITRPHP